MKRVLLVGNVACGKTTLCQRLNGLEQTYKKTQALEVINRTIDTPGEYLEHRSLLRALVVTSVEVDVVLTGEVAAVTEAVQAGVHTPNAQGMLVSSVVIPSPHPELLDSLLCL